MKAAMMTTRKKKIPPMQSAVDGEGRFKAHKGEGRGRFRHLENFDLNMNCARVVIKARKP